MSEKNCKTCKYSEESAIYDKCIVCKANKYYRWEPQEVIKGVAYDETVTNENGGKQSKLEYRFDLIDAKALFAVARVMHEGAQKYEKDNWRKIDVNDHLNHAISHIYAYLAGDEQDDHLEHAATRLLMALGVKGNV